MKLAKHRGLTFAVALAVIITSNVSTVFAQPASQLSTCNFSKSIHLRSTTRYGIFGDDQFDTLVCGYLVTRTEERSSGIVTIAYFRINQFGDEGFKNAIAKGIAEDNTVNTVKSGVYDFSLGCFKNGKIEGERFKENTIYMTADVQKRIVASSPKKLVSLILSFEKYPGVDCVCCHLADRVKLH